MRPIVVIESPYAGDIDRNVAYARAAIRDSILRGEAPYASHLLYTQPGILRDEDAGERTMGIETGLNFHRVASLVAFYVDNGWSKGMRAAEALCFDAGTPIDYRTIGQAACAPETIYDESGYPVAEVLTDDKTVEDCKSKFNIHQNFRGAQVIPEGGQ